MTASAIWWTSATDCLSILVSDFVTPQYFQANAPKDDLRGHVTAPLQLLAGGYTLV